MNNQPIITDTTAEISAPADAAVQHTAVCPAPAKDKGDSLSVASFIFGLISVIFLPLGTIPGALGFALSLDAKKRGSSHHLLSAGRVMSIIGMVTVPALYGLLLILSLAMMALMMFLGI